MLKNRVETTLFMLMSVDGKISTGDRDILDFDQDLPRIKGVKEGLPQYYKLENRTDLHSLNTGRVFAKIGINKKMDKVKKLPVSFIIIDNKPHLKKRGMENLLKRSKTLYLVTSNNKHPAFKTSARNLRIIYYPKRINFSNLLAKLKQKHKVKRVTVQSGGTLNAALLRKGLIDHVSIVVAPCLIGGKNTSTVIDGESLHVKKDLALIKALKLKKCKALRNSYIHLQYDVIQN